mgnify:CR=1 FL=1
MWFDFRRVNANGTLGLSNRLDWNVRGTALAARNDIEAVLTQVLEPRLNRQGSRWAIRQSTFNTMPAGRMKRKTPNPTLAHCNE